MVIIFYGTGAELVKILGVVQRIPRAQQYLICTAQQHAGLEKVHKQLGVEPDLYLARGWHGKDVANMKQMLALMLTAHLNFLRSFRKIKRTLKQRDQKFKTRSVAVVHGDTLTTVVGSYLGRFLGLPVAHIEAGLRSGSWKSPFPEELDRRIASKVARIHFPPNELAEKNLRGEGVKGEIISTSFNTAKDAIDQADKYVSDNFEKLNLPDNYCLVLLHRTELLEKRADLEAILKTLSQHADNNKNIVFTQHTTTKERIKGSGLTHYLEHKFITVIEKQPYFDFMAIVKKADYIVTDGGGLQEDAFFLGVPVIVHRERTERQEGIGINASLSGMDTSKVAAFLENHSHKSQFKQLAASVSPSEVIVNYFIERSYIKI